MKCLWCQDFDETTDGEVRHLLEPAADPRANSDSFWSHAAISPGPRNNSRAPRGA
jgi:hypothetical protein